MSTEKDQDLEVVKSFVKNFMKAKEDNAPKDGGKECDSNCDCYIETEIARAAGIGGYRYGS
jgi:hypothetical protein